MELAAQIWPENLLGCFWQSRGPKSFVTVPEELLKMFLVILSLGIQIHSRTIMGQWIYNLYVDR